MNFTENLKEALNSIRSNLLRTILTAAIIAVGITCLVGILTAIDGLQSEINTNLSSLGANSFDIKAMGEGWGGRREGRQRKVYPPIKYKDAVKFKDLYSYDGLVSLSTNVTNNAEVKYMSKMTNPNVRIMGINENYFTMKGYDLSSGRSFSNIELKYGSNVAVIGSEIVKNLYEKKNPLNEDIGFMGKKFRIVGVLKEEGSSFGGGGSDRSIFIPLIAANRLGQDRELRYEITVSISNPLEMEHAMSEARGLMRSIRQDRIGKEESFEIARSESVADSLNEVTGYLKIGGFVFGFVTLLGASIGLMNIMMVSVTERTKEIGVRKALGATKKRIRQQFLLEAIVICQIGGMAGVVLGILVGNVLAAILSVSTFVFPWFWMMVGLIICIVVGLISGYYPAYKASKLDPIESLRFE
ncbi:MAG TPA: ABC transporter permease [Cytophagales bacterium]|nr:ABC transporter permease [Cytophagales bacterium]